MTTLTRDGLRKLVGEWMAAGKVCVGPVRVAAGTVLFTRLASAEDLRLEGWLRPANSIKELVLPRHEPLYGYRADRNRIELLDPPETIPEQIAICAHPCDAAALPILDKVFNWDYRDEAYNRRREATTVITLACTASDDECFCTSVGLGPDAERGSDAMLFDLGDGSFAVRTLTDKGRAALGEAGAQGGKTDPPPVRFDAKEAGQYAAEHFDDPFWREHALACVGCGACAFTCPVCHCFDIVDERNGHDGMRARNWDACQFPLFTLHASGHNPRHTQGDRQRQRIYHKFHMYPEKFGETLCTGCGNCARNCPVGLGVLPLVTEIPHAEPVQA
jgi:ferredoxin